MARVKRAVNSHKKRRKILDRASGYRGPALPPLPQGPRAAAAQLHLQLPHREKRKGDFRRLWIQRINAAARAHGMTYNRFIQGLKAAESRG